MPRRCARRRNISTSPAGGSCSTGGAPSGRWPPGIDHLQYVISVSDTHSRHNAGASTADALVAFEELASGLATGPGGADDRADARHVVRLPVRGPDRPGRGRRGARRRAAQAGAASIGLADTIGVAMPTEVADARRARRRRHRRSRSEPTCTTPAGWRSPTRSWRSSTARPGSTPRRRPRRMPVRPGSERQPADRGPRPRPRGHGDRHRVQRRRADRGRRAGVRRGRPPGRESRRYRRSEVRRAGTVSRMTRRLADEHAHVAVVAGKGGVGSSTVAAAMALAAARQGADVLFVAVDGRPGMGPLLGGPSLDDTDRILQRVKGAGQVRGRTIPAAQAFGDYLDLKGVGGLLRRAASATSLPMIAAATPGPRTSPRARQDQGTRARARRRPDRRRRAAGRPRCPVPAFGDRSLRRRAVGPDPRTGGGGARDAARPGALSGAARHAPRGHPRDRAARTRRPNSATNSASRLLPDRRQRVLARSCRA